LKKEKFKFDATLIITNQYVKLEKKGDGQKVSNVNIKKDIKKELEKFCKLKGIDMEWFTNAILRGSMYGLNEEKIQKILGDDLVEIDIPDKALAQLSEMGYNDPISISFIISELVEKEDRWRRGMKVWQPILSKFNIKL